MEFLQYVLIAYYYSVPYVLAFGAAFALIGIAAGSLRWPLLPVLAYLTVYFSFSGSTYGAVTGSASTIYSRGSGQLYFPFVLWGLVLSVFWGHLSARLSQLPRVESPGISPWLWAWFWLLVAHACVGLLLDIDFDLIISSDGFINLLWMGVFVALLIGSVRGRGTLQLLCRFIVVAALLRAGFGLVRWAAFGGDPSNVYGNIEKIDVKLTFFDITDSLVCVLGGAVAASQLLLQRDEGASRVWRLLQWVALLACIACVLLSFRRTAWFGILLSGMWLFYCMRPSLRILGIGMVLPILTVAITYLFLQRLGRQTGKYGAFAFFYDLIGTDSRVETPRSLELRMAMETFLQSPLFGVGSWGSYGATRLIPWQNPFHPGGFMHSGILHILFKTGLVGGALVLGTVRSFVIEVRACKNRDADSAALIFAAISGLLFMIPDFLLGTPIPELRLTQLLGLCLALPFVVTRAQRLDAAS